MSEQKLPDKNKEESSLAAERVLLDYSLQVAGGPPAIIDFMSIDKIPTK